jgi:hypothetical protein
MTRRMTSFPIGDHKPSLRPLRRLAACSHSVPLSPWLEMDHKPPHYGVQCEVRFEHRTRPSVAFHVNECGCLTVGLLCGTAAHQSQPTRCSRGTGVLRLLTDAVSGNRKRSLAAAISPCSAVRSRPSIVRRRGFCPRPMLKPNFHFASPSSRARYKTDSVIYFIPRVVSLTASSSFPRICIFRSLPKTTRLFKAVT